MLPLILAPAVLLSAAAALATTTPAVSSASIAASPSSIVPWNGSRSSWEAPIEPPVLVAAFAPPARAWLPGHRGVDLRAGRGQPVHAAGSGTVTWAGPLAGRGVVVVTHDDGLRTTYEPVDPAVAEGDRVEAGQILGTVGDGDVHCGRAPGCLHWGLRRGEEYLDPWRLLHPGRAVLLPP